MHLEKISGVKFYDQLEPIEQYLTPAYVGWLREWGIFLVGGLSVATGFFASWLGVAWPLAVVISIPTVFATLYGMARFFDEQKYLPANAREFYRLNLTEMNIIGSEVEAFNYALDNQKDSQLLLSSGDQKDDRALANYWEKRRMALQEKANVFVNRFRVAVSDDLQYMDEQRETNPKLLRRAYKKKMRQLKELEASLGNLPENQQDGAKDIAPYMAANKLREQLEQEQLELDKLGLKQKKLPKARLLLRKAR